MWILIVAGILQRDIWVFKFSGYNLKLMPEFDSKLINSLT